MPDYEIKNVEWANVIDAIEECYSLGWTDGLPVVPPEQYRVQEFIDYVGRDPDEILGEVPERRRQISLLKTAANAVMAGCLPEYFPVVSLSAWLLPMTGSYHLLGVYCYFYQIPVDVGGLVFQIYVSGNQQYQTSYFPGPVPPGIKHVE